MTEAELYKGLVRGDQKALSCLIDTFTGPVYDLISRILSGVASEEDLEECCSDVFFTSWKEIHRYQPGRASLRTWLLIIAKYKALDYRRKLLRKVSLAAGEMKDICGQAPAPEELVLLSEQRSRIINALAELSSLDKELVYRRYFLCESIDKLASDLRLTRKAVDNRLWRARKVLRTCLEEKRGKGAVDSETE